MRDCRGVVWLAAPINLARAPIDPAAKLECVSYAPFRGDQTPLDPTTQVPPEQIDAGSRAARDRSRNACAPIRSRTVSIRFRALQPRSGLKVMQGIWLGSNRLKNQQQIATAVALTKDYPGTIIR